MNQPYLISNAKGDHIASPTNPNDQTIAAALTQANAPPGQYYLHNPNGRHAATLQWTPAQINWKPHR